MDCVFFLHVACIIRLLFPECNRIRIGCEYMDLFNVGHSTTAPSTTEYSYWLFNTRVEKGEWEWNSSQRIVTITGSLGLFIRLFVSTLRSGTWQEESSEKLVSDVLCLPP